MGAPAPMPADAKKCPQCARVLLPTMKECPFCAPQVKQNAGGTDQAVPALGAAVAPAAPAGEAMPAGTAYLDVLDGSMKGQRMVLSQQPMTIGRADDNAICLKDPSVSSHHARVDFYQGKYYISDLQSSNGTYVNNQRVEQAQLNNQDVVALGSTRVIINCQ
jgi:hypothetical protein